MQRIVSACIAIAVLTLLAGCSSYRHHQWRVGDQGSNDTSEYSLRFIEADDEGWFWDKEQPAEAMRLIRSKVAERDTIVLVFVHGWHHSAACCDGNVEGFRQTLQKLRSTLNPSFNIVGLYVGWRGQSLPMPLNYLTFWGRKGAAERVGQNDLKEFLARLQELYAEFRPDVLSKTGPGTQQRSPNFLGLVTLAHSFGAQIVLKAVAGSIEDELQRLNPNPAYLRGAQPARRDSQRSHSISGLGDLVILMNPAAEASQYHRLHILSQGLNYSSLQTPVILTVSAENDKSRHRLFTIGRYLGEIFTGKPRKDDEVQRAVERQALGVYPGHVTHQLVPTDANVRLVATTVRGDARKCKEGEACEVRWHTWSSAPVSTKQNSLKPGDPALKKFDFSKNVVFNDVELSALTEAVIRAGKEEPQAYGTAQPYQPFIVARASKEIIDDHSGIFTDPFLRFLVPYIAYIEEKSRANVEPNRRLRQTPASTP